MKSGRQQGRVRVEAEVVNYAEKDLFVIGASPTAAAQLLPDSRLDEMACNNGSLFLRRFGIDATSIAREKLMALKRVGRFTDREFRRLKLTGRISVRDESVKCLPRTWMLLFGWTQIIFLAPLLLSSILGILTLPAERTAALLGLLAVLAVGTGAAYLVWWVYIGPYYLVRRRIGRFVG